MEEENNKVTMIITIDQDLKKKFKVKCAIDDTDMTAQISVLIKEYVTAESI